MPDQEPGEDKTVEHNKPVLLQTLPESAFPTDVNALEDTVDTHKQEDLMATTDGAKGEARVQLPLFDNQDIYSKIPELSLSGRSGGRRYAIGELLGEGGYGCVFDLRDNNFERNVAVKMLSGDHAENVKILRNFTHEALISAQLDHPNILPVYDMDVSEDGSLFYTMKKVEGYSLIEALENEIPEGVDNQIKSMDDIVRIFIKVAEAMSYAHSKGIVHQDIKPSNIMLGDFGEVSVVDWGSAVDTKVEESDRGRLVGTPMYMSPEQSRREGADERSDIYCLGSSLFHALTGHFAMWHESQRVFWQYKKEGIIDPLTPEDEQNVPKPLVAICFKCLDPEPEERYQTVEELADDLKNYQAGLSVGVYHYSFLEFFKQWSKQHQEALYGGIVILLLLMAGFVFVYIEHLKELSGWGEPLLVETFENDQDWREDWNIYRGTFAVENGQLVTKDGPAFFAFYDKRIYGSVAIEFDGEMLKGSPPCDLSVAYISNFMEVEQGGYALEDLHLLQNGGYHNSCSMILGPEGRLDYENIQLENERVYKVRAEIDGNHMRLFLDGDLVCSTTSAFPRTSGYIGIYGYFHSKAFDNVKIYTKKVAEKVTIMETADVFYTNELYQNAIDQYTLINESHKGTPLAEEAQYKKGLCYYKLEKYEQAVTVWGHLKTDVYRNQVQGHQWDLLEQEDKYLDIIQGMESLYKSSSDAQRSRIQTKWVRFVNRQLEKNIIDQLPKYIDFWETNFPNDPVSSFEVTRALQTVGDYERIKQFLSDYPVCMVEYYRSKGQFDTIVDKFPNMRHQRLGVLVRQREFEKALNEYQDMKSSCGDIYILLGKYDEAVAKYGEHRPIRAKVMLLRGEYDKVIKEFPEVGWGELTAYMLSGRYQEFHARAPDKASALELYQVQMCEALQLFIDNKHAAAFERMNDVQRGVVNFHPSWSPQLFAQFFQAAALQSLSGNKTVFQEVLKNYEDKSYTIRARLGPVLQLLNNSITKESFMQQPDQLYADSYFLFYSALREDLAGNRNQARQFYRAYLGLPTHERDMDICKERFAQWRLQK